MPRAAAGLETLRRRADFVAATRDAVKIGGPLIGLQVLDRGDPAATPRVGLTVTKRVGGSVERSRMKRRLRAAVALALPGAARSGCDYVLVARRAVLDAKFDRIVRDLGEAVRRAHGRLGRAPRRDDAAPERSPAPDSPPNDRLA
ncbi:ribonuclease P protein component [Methylopila henanensis]|uniref:Ribonuclease P protein component n=1 Tax=Methylopila henanensis TaxID=873516 RepID=A0ABW4K767_9HYPH